MAEGEMTHARYRYRERETGVIEGRIFHAEPGEGWTAELKELVPPGEVLVTESLDPATGEIVLRYRLNAPIPERITDLDPPKVKAKRK